MSRTARRGGLRARIAAAAARIMAEDGMDDFALAKRKAARALGVADGPALPGNEEIETELRAYRELYQAAEHSACLAELRHAALRAMRALERFRPYLTGGVLTGLAGANAPIELQLFPDDAKDVEIFLIERGITFAARESRRFAGDRAHAITLLSLTWEGIEFRLAVLDSRDERLALRTSQAGRVLERAGIREVAGLVATGHVAS